MVYKAHLSVLLLGLVSSFLQADTILLPVTIPVKPGETIFENTLVFTVDHPSIRVTEWHSTSPAIELFDELTQSTKKAFQEPISLIVTLESEAIPENSHVDIYYIIDNTKKSEHIALDIPATPVPEIAAQEKENTKDRAPVSFPVIESKSFVRHVLDTFHNIVTFIKTTLSNLLEHNDSVWLRLLVVFFLGILMSFTPCIYPMIPVTVGLLQLSIQRSLFQNFLIALCYTLGIGTTFALLGLIVASGSAHFGMMLSSPLFVAGVVLLLLYLAFSLFDFYPLYTPRFMKHSGKLKSSSAFISAFIFGAASGTILSPCLSPGLALVLTFVAHLSNIWLGFLLLFAFGVGSSIPLLIIGTFSTTLTIFPHAGAWMEEIKKIFGMLLLVSAYSYAHIIIPEWLLYFLAAGLLVFLGIYYAQQSAHTHTIKLRRYRSLIAIILMSLASVMAYNGIVPLRPPYEQSWILNFEEALHEARSHNQYMIIDFGASWCTLCHQVDKEIFNNAHIQKELDRFIRVKIDCSDPSAPTCEPYLKQFTIKGFPTIVLYDPEKKNVIKLWQSEILDQGIEAFAEELRTY